MSDAVFQQIVSVGPACRAKFQIQRLFGERIARRGVFDWQLTPAHAFTEYLRRDFKGMFERADLRVEENAVSNVRFETLHIHEFPPDVTSQGLDALYHQARLAHDQWCANTRAAMRNRHSTLFVFSGEVDAEVTAALHGYIERTAPGKHYLVLNAPADPEVDWKGTTSIWDAHLGPFRVKPSFQLLAKDQLYRLRKNLKFVVPTPVRKKLAN